MNNFKIFRMNRLVLFFAFYLGSVLFNVAHAQTHLQKGDTAASRKEYFTAIDFYQKFLKKQVAEGAENEVYFKIGSCYAAINNYKEARIWIEKSFLFGYSEPSALLVYGDVLMLSGEYSTAKSAFQKYIEQTGDKSAKRKLASCDFALTGKKSDINYEIKNEVEINSDFSDFGLTMVKNKLVFSSSRVEEGSKFDNFTGQGFSDIYETTLDSKKNKWTKPLKLKGGINTKYNEGAFVYDKKNNIGYYMKCNGEKNKKENCNIFSSVWKEKENVWEESKPFDFSDEIFSTGQPAISSDGNTIYFVSNMDGGIGGKDIWVIKRKNKVWGEPKNLGSPVNTTGNEMFPYVADDTMLYFSSDGNIGFGGLDIFGSKIKGSSYGKPQNLLAPINSCADDFGIIFTGNSILEGYFCSNRAGGKGEDDIYSFKKAPLILNAKGIIVNSESGKAVSRVKVYFKGSDYSIDSTITSSKGEFNFMDLKPGLEYVVTAVKSGFFSDSKDLTTVGLEDNYEFSKKTGMDLDFGLIKITKKERNIPNIYYDFNKAEIKSESRKELNKMARILQDTPGIKVQINSHTDEIGTADYNMKLSEKRAQNVVDYFIAKGVDKTRLSYMGYGESIPMKKNAQTERDHQINRRTTFKVIEK